MKKLIVLGLVIIAFSTHNTQVASTQTANSPAQPTTATNARTTMVEIIDGIGVPMDVLMYAQTEYVGHAVIKAEKIQRDGKQLYRLRVDRDQIPDDYDSFYLLYDMGWQLVGNEKASPPPQIKVEIGPPTQSDRPSQSGPGRIEIEIRGDNGDDNDNDDKPERSNRRRR